VLPKTTKQVLPTISKLTYLWWVVVVLYLRAALSLIQLVITNQEAIFFPFFISLLIGYFICMQKNLSQAILYPLFFFFCLLLFLPATLSGILLHLPRYTKLLYSFVYLIRQSLIPFHMQGVSQRMGAIKLLLACT
jgi:uncharacterized membrane protein YjjP (DUF1212 family)